jgi:hypothetical protein
MTTEPVANNTKYSCLMGRGLEAYRSIGYSRDDAERGSRRNRDWNRDRLLHIGGTIGEGSVKHANYRACDMAVALILAALTVDGGVTAREAIQEVSSACYNWTKFTKAQGTARAMHPIIAALEGIERYELWVLRVDVRKSDQTGKVGIRAALYDADGTPPGNDFPDEFLPHITMHVHLGPLLMPLIGAINGRVGTN